MIISENIIYSDASIIIELFTYPEVYFLMRKHPRENQNQSKEKLQHPDNKKYQEARPIKIYLRNEKRKNLGIKNDILAKALGWKTHLKLNVIDATVGLGRDFDHILSLGCSLVGFEQNVYLHKALQLAFPEQQLINETAETILQNEKAATLFPDGVVDVVYLDPMFPEKKKSAAVGKESLLLQYLTDSLPENSDIDLFHAAALSCAKRIVVKRPLKTQPFVDVVSNKKRKLSHSYSGKAVRYDVYI